MVTARREVLGAPMLLYHSTPKDRLAKIRREGLKPNGNVIRQENPSPFCGPVPQIGHSQIARLSPRCHWVIHLVTMSPLRRPYRQAGL
jgi:hypothetical protein